MLKFYILFFLFIISFMILFSCKNENKNHILTKQEAEKLMKSYVNTLKSGEVEEIKKYWTNKSLSRKGFEVMHIWIGMMIHINEWKDFLEQSNYTYQISELLDKEDYYIINGEWSAPNNDSNSQNSYPMPFYLIWENNNWLLINPIDVLTKNWNRYETDNMVFFYSSETNIDDHLYEIRLLDEKFQTMCQAMDYYFDHKVEYYKVSSPEECGRLFSQPRANGLAAVTYQDTIPWFQVAASTTFYNPHEVMHVIALASGVPFSIPIFSEGLAVAYGGTTFQTADYAHNFSKNLLDDPEYIPIQQLLKMSNRDFLRKNYITYQESGSFLRYLIDQYGIGKLKSLISSFNKNEDLNAQFMESYDLSLDILENNWIKFLRGIELPEIEFSVPNNAELVFSMTDPKNDDEGDGDYEYPDNDNYVKGCFDLTKFEVLKDNKNAYFKIGLQNIIKPVSINQGRNKFVPAIVIAINKGNEKKRPLYKFTNEVELFDGYDFKINVGMGINISNNLGKIFVSSDDLYNEIADIESYTLTFSLPIELISEPVATWKYFVGVGLTNKPAFNFSGLTPVFKNVPVLIRGGNYNHSNPAFIDILLPREINQEDVLSNYNPEKGKFSKIKMVSNIDGNL